MTVESSSQPGSLRAAGKSAAEMRVPELDGIRGFAILAVLLTHLQQVLFPIALFGTGWPHVFGKALDHVLQTGWMGVDVFFVLSGFLITGIILRSADQPTFYKGFYLRRAARILPIFLVVFFTVIAIIPRLRWTVYAAYLFFMANWLVLTPFEVPVLGNLWSLAVEEQFYLFWPPVVRNLKRQTLLRVALLVAATSVLLRIVLTFAHVWVFTIYKITPTRLDGLALGAALAAGLQLSGPRSFLFDHWRKITAVALAIFFLGFLSMKGSYYAHHPRSLVLGSCSVEVMTCMLIFGSLEQKLPSAIKNVLLQSPLRWLGRRSYGLYLIHSPVLTASAFWLKQKGLISLGSSAVVCVLVIGLSFFLAELSWRAIESPAVRYGHRKTHRSDATAVRSLA